jgi:defect-in-organelle-trafficking protein DotB
MPTDPGLPLFPGEPALAWRRGDLDAFLLWAADRGCSDIVMSSAIRPRVRLQGRWWQAGVRPIETQATMVPMLIESSRAQDAWARLQGRQFLDYAYEVALPGMPWKKRRFRVNATACRDGHGVGVSLVFRTIPDLPPKIADLGVPEALVKELYPGNGLVLVTGVMGSGKSTTLSAVLREIVEVTDRFTITYESPIEFDLMALNDLAQNGAFVVQSEIGSHLERFEDAPKNSTRRAADVVLYGEARDRATVGGMIEQAEVGTAVYATAHTPSVAATPGRVINVFPSEDQPSMAAGFFGAIRLIVQQRLLKTPEGGRVAVREWLAFDDSMRKDLMGMPLSSVYHYLEEQTHKKGMPLLRAAETLYAEGRVLEEDIEQIRAEKRTGEAHELA